MPPRKSASQAWRDGYDAGYADCERVSGRGPYSAAGRARATRGDSFWDFDPPAADPPRRRIPRGGPLPKRRKTAYQTAYSVAYKRLKKKHPRMAFGSLSKKAHAAARKKVK